MNYNGFNSFEDFMRFCGVKVDTNTSSENKSSDSDNTEDDDKTSRCENCKPGNGQGEADEKARNADSDIPGGFQDIPPQLLLVIGELLGNIIAGNLPFNVQNVVGNWLQLVGQAIEVFNAQQQYYQGGPGRYYNYIYRNVANPFCTSSVDESQTSISVNENEQKSNKGKRSNKNGSSSKSSNTSSEIEELKECICYLTNQIQELKNDIDKLKNQKM